jgi:hypothetical protein
MIALVDARKTQLQTEIMNVFIIGFHSSTRPTKLVVEPEKSAVNQAKGLIVKAQREIGDCISQPKKSNISAIAANHSNPKVPRNPATLPPKVPVP